LMYASSWNWIVAANILLGINQGLTWSSTVVMKIDLVGEKHRGLAMGLNEFAGYVSLSAVAFLTGWIAGTYGLRPYPFYLGVVISFLGFFCSWIFVRDTKHHVHQEASSSKIPHLKNIFWETTWKNKNLGSVTQAGLINNLNDGMAWGIFPILLASKNFNIQQIGLVAAVYPAFWGFGMVITGKMADKLCKKDMLFWGMMAQAIALLLFSIASSISQFILLAVLLGWGTAMVYPTLLASVAEHSHPNDRAKSLGVFRFWRDLGYAIGALLTGIIADAIGIIASIIFIGVLTALSGLIVNYRMTCDEKNSRKIAEWLFSKR